MELTAESILSEVLAKIRQGRIVLHFKGISITVYSFFAVVAEILEVLVEKEVKDPINVLQQMLEARRVCDLIDKFDRPYTAIPVSQELALFNVFLGQNLPVFGEEYLTGELRKSDMIILSQHLEWLLQPATRFTTFCRQDEDITVSYCLNKVPEIAVALGYEFTICGTGNLVTQVEGFKWVV